MIRITCDKCGKELNWRKHPAFATFDPGVFVHTYNCGDPVNDTPNNSIESVTIREKEGLRMVDLCDECGIDVFNYIFSSRLAKEQESPTDALISSALECLLHPQDADDSDIVKAIDVAVKALKLLKEQEPVEPSLDYDGNDVWRCGNCHRNIFHPSHTDADEDEKNYRRFCVHCGRAVKWE